MDGRRGHDRLRGGHWRAANGARSIDLNGFNPSSVFQTFDTRDGEDLRALFCMAANPDGPPDLKRMQLRASDPADATKKQESLVFSFDRTGRTAQNMGWSRGEFAFRGYAGTTKLDFISLTTEAVVGKTDKPYGPALDSVAMLLPQEYKKVELRVNVLRGATISRDDIDVKSRCNRSGPEVSRVL